MQGPAARGDTTKARVASKVRQRARSGSPGEQHQSSGRGADAGGHSLKGCLSRSSRSTACALRTTGPRTPSTRSSRWSTTAGTSGRGPPSGSGRGRRAGLLGGAGLAVDGRTEDGGTRSAFFWHGGMSGGGRKRVSGGQTRCGVAAESCSSCHVGPSLCGVPLATVLVECSLLCRLPSRNRRRWKCTCGVASLSASRTHACEFLGAQWHWPRIGTTQIFRRQ